jgi:hypothetical protein
LLYVIEPPFVPAPPIIELPDVVNVKGMVLDNVIPPEKVTDTVDMQDEPFQV